MTEWFDEYENYVNHRCQLDTYGTFWTDMLYYTLHRHQLKHQMRDYLLKEWCYIHAVTPLGPGSKILSL